MVERTYIDIQFKGKKFSPKKLMDLTQFPLEILAESGETAAKGRYRGKSSPYGLALLKLNNNQEAMEQWCDILIDKKKELKMSNVDEIIFDVESSPENFKNFSITPLLASKLIKLKAKINFSRIPEDDFDELINKIIIHSHKSSAPQNDLLFKNLEKIAILYKHQNISPKFTYGLVVYLLDWFNSQNKLESSNFKTYLEEYQE